MEGYCQIWDFLFCSCRKFFNSLSYQVPQLLLKWFQNGLQDDNNNNI